MYSIYVDYSNNAVIHTCMKWQAYLLGAYATIVKCMCTSVSLDIVDFIEFISGIYTDIAAL